jgi:hypothetical protein
MNFKLKYKNDDGASIFKGFCFEVNIVKMTLKMACKLVTVLARHFLILYNLNKNSNSAGPSLSNAAF